MNSPEVSAIDNSSIVAGLFWVFPIEHLQVFLHCLQELVLHSRVAENVVGSNARLPGVHELAPDNSLCSSADVDIIHDNTGTAGEKGHKIADKLYRLYGINEQYYIEMFTQKWSHCRTIMGQTQSFPIFKSCSVFKSLIYTHV